MMLLMMNVVMMLMGRGVSGFFISSSSSDIGNTLEVPARSGDNVQPIQLTCELSFNTGEQWTACSWSHSFPDVVAYDGNEAFVMCSSTHMDDDGQECEDQGNLKGDSAFGSSYEDPATNPYSQYDTSRLLYAVSQTSCGLTIINPHANDTGIWTCRVSDNNPSGQTSNQRGEVELFVATESEVAITNPDLTEDPGNSLEVEVNGLYSSSDIIAECTALYGSPPPTIVWYIDDINNEVATGVSQSIQTDGSVVSEIILALDLSMLTRYSIETVNDMFAFSLGCYPDQGNYFPDRDENIRNPAEVMVYGSASSASTLVSQFGFLLGLIFVSQSFFL